jgi:hypothetical protein
MTQGGISLQLPYDSLRDKIMTLADDVVCILRMVRGSAAEKT